MDINITYTAKDGRRFNDPYECEEYEKRLGTEPGTVGRARIDLKALGETNGDFEKAKEIARELKLKAQFPGSEIAMAARRPGVTGLGMKFEYPDGTVRDKWGNIIKDEEE